MGIQSHGFIPIRRAGQGGVILDNQKVNTAGGWPAPHLALILSELDAAIVFVEHTDYFVDIFAPLYPPRAGTLTIYFGFLAWGAVFHDELAVSHADYFWAASAGAE